MTFSEINRRPTVAGDERERSGQGPCPQRSVSYLTNNNSPSGWGCHGRPNTYLSFSSLVSSFWVCSSSWRSLMCSSWRSWISAFTAWSLEKSWNPRERQMKETLQTTDFSLFPSQDTSTYPCSFYTFLSFLVLMSTSCCNELYVSLSSKVSSSRLSICCWISLSRRFWEIAQNSSACLETMSIQGYRTGVLQIIDSH